MLLPIAPEHFCFSFAQEKQGRVRTLSGLFSSIRHTQAPKLEVIYSARPFSTLSTPPPHRPDIRACTRQHSCVTILSHGVYRWRLLQHESRPSCPPRSPLFLRKMIGVLYACVSRYIIGTVGTGQSREAVIACHTVHLHFRKVNPRHADFQSIAHRISPFLQCLDFGGRLVCKPL